MVFQWRDSPLIIQHSSNTNSPHAHTFDKGPSENVSVELLIAAKGQAERDHLFGVVDRAAFNFIISCTAANALPTLCTRTAQMRSETELQSFPSYVQLVVLSRSAYAILVNNWLDTFEKGVKIHVLIGDQYIPVGAMTFIFWWCEHNLSDNFILSRFGIILSFNVRKCSF